MANPGSIDEVLQLQAEATRAQADASAMALHSAGAADVLAKSQGFFAEYAASVAPPHVSIEHKGFVAAMLLRAEECGLFKPERK